MPKWTDRLRNFFRWWAGPPTSAALAAVVVAQLALLWQAEADVGRRVEDGVRQGGRGGPEPAR